MKAREFNQNLIRRVIVAGLCIFVAMLIVSQVHALLPDRERRADGRCQSAGRGRTGK